MKVDREKALVEWSGKIETAWSPSQLAAFICDVLESQSHLWERGESAPDVLRDYKLHAASQRIAELESGLNIERGIAKCAETEVAKLRAELERCSRACDEAKRKADDHRRQRDGLERKAAEDAALIKSLQEQLVETKADLAGAKEYAERTAESCRKFLAERDAALAKLEKLNHVLKVRPGESAFGYGVRVRDEAAEVPGGNHG